jgi:hypothetical protein
MWFDGFGSRAVAMKPDMILRLSSGAVGTHLQFSSIAAPKTVKGVPTQRFRKVIIKAGEFYQESKDLKFKVTPRLIDHWQDQYRNMAKNDVRVSIPNTHEGEGDADQNRGYVDGMFAEKDEEGIDQLVMTCEMIGEDGIAAAARSDVSITVPESYTDGKGNKYELPIRSVALCTDPVIPGLGEFVPIAASSKSRSKNMDWAAFKKKFAIEGDMTDANALELVEKKFGEQALPLKELSEAVSLSSQPTAGTVVKMVTEKFASLKDELTKGDAKPDKPGAELLRLSRVNKDNMLSALVTAGRIIPAVKDGLAKLFLNEDALVLSFSSKAAGEQFDTLIELLKVNDPVELAKQNTGPQTLTLSDGLKPKQASNPMVDTAKNRAEKFKEHQAITAGR